MLRFASVRALPGFRVEATLTDGTVRVDLRDHLRGPVFADIAASEERFAEVYVDPTAKTLAWPGGIDLDPDVLLGAPWARQAG